MLEDRGFRVSSIREDETARGRRQKSHDTDNEMSLIAIYLFHVVVLQRYQNVKSACCKSLSYNLEPIVQHCTRAALTGLIIRPVSTENFPALS